MLTNIIVLVLLAVAGWVLWLSKTEDGWDFKKGFAVVVVAAGAAWSWWVDGWDWVVNLVSSL